MTYHVYILYSKSHNKFYKGQTSDLSNRLYRHNSRQEPSTKHAAPWKLIWVTQKNTRADALALEKKLKNLSQSRLLEFMKKYNDGLASKNFLSQFEP